MATTASGKTGGATPRPGLFVRKPTDQLTAESSGSGLSRSVGALDLTALGVGVVIGAGIYVIIGEAIPLSGPAIVSRKRTATLGCRGSCGATRTSSRRTSSTRSEVR